VPFFAALLASVLYLLPTVVVAAAARPRRAHGDLAVTVSAAVAADLLLILLLARLVPVDVAALLSRALWAAAGVALLVARRLSRGPAAEDARPRPDRARTVVLGAAAVLGFAVSCWLSRPYALWDRQWHIPLVTSLRGQRLPFVNVYQPGLRLGYHVSGDVLAAVVQTLSWGRLHSSAALSLTHDLLFALTALVAAALVLRAPAAERRPRWLPWLAALGAPLAVLLAGPLTVLGSINGFSYFNFLQMSFRPHVVLAGLLIAGVAAAVVQGLGPDRASARWALPATLASLALLAVTDEPAAVMLVPALALVVFLRRGAAARRWSWLAVAALFPVTVALAMALFPSALVGGPHPDTTVIAPHVPSLLAPSLRLPSARGFATLAADMAPMVALLVAAAALAWPQRRRGAGVAVAFALALFVMGCGLLTTVVAGKSEGESHRFMTLPMVALPVVGLGFVAQAGRRWASALLALALGAPVVCGAVWAVAGTPMFVPFTAGNYAPGIHQLDCRAVTGAALGEPAQPTYVPGRGAYVWAGCHPVLTPGRTAGTGATGDFPDVGRPIDGPPAFAALTRRFLTPAQDLVVACPTDEARDPICRLAAAARGASCVSAGTGWRRCLLPPRSR
jgi:hypothetical protein